MRRAVHSIGDGALMFGLDDRTFAIVVTSIFMQITGIVMLPQFLGPSFSPIVWLGDVLSRPFRIINPFPTDKALPDANSATKETDLATKESTNDQTIETPAKSKRRNRRKKKAA